MPDHTLTISWGTILKIFIALGAAYVLFLARNIFIWFFFALVISVLLDPAVRFLRKLRIPKGLAAVMVYLSLLLLLGLIVYLASPVFLFELRQLSQNLPLYFAQASPILKSLGINVAENFNDFVAGLSANLQTSSAGIAKAVMVFFGGVSSAVLIFTLAFFISLGEGSVEKVLALLVPQKYEAYTAGLFRKVQVKVAGWFMARILACLFVGAASFLVFFFLGARYAFTLALMSGVLNFIPYIGPAITLLVSVLFVGVSSNWTMAIFVLVALLAIQEVENKLLSPVLMKKFIDLPPVLVLLSLLVGGTLFGFMGTLFSVPVFGIVYEFLKEFLEKRKEAVWQQPETLQE